MEYIKAILDFLTIVLFVALGANISWQCYNIELKLIRIEAKIDKEIKP